MSVPEPERLNVLGLWPAADSISERVAGMVAVTTVLARSGTGLLAAVASDHSLTATLARRSRLRRIRQDR